MSNRVNYGGPQNSLSAHLCARRHRQKRVSKVGRKRKRREGQMRMSLISAAANFFLVHFSCIRQHCTRAAKLNWSISSSPPTKIRCLYYPKKSFPHVLRRIRNKVKRSSQSEISCINMTMTRRMYACIASKSFSRLDNFSVSPWVKKLKLGDNGQWTEPSKISSACVQVNSTLGAFSHAPVGPALTVCDQLFPLRPLQPLSPMEPPPRLPLGHLAPSGRPRIQVLSQRPGGGEGEQCRHWAQGTHTGCFPQIWKLEEKKPMRLFCRKHSLLERSMGTYSVVISVTSPPFSFASTR